MTRKIPNLSDLYQLAAQLERDKEASIKALRTRDHRIGLACDARDDSARLLYWLQQVSSQRQAGEQPGNTWPINPAKLMLSRIYPDPRYFSEAQSVLRMAFLRYGQEMGALFTVGAMLGFIVVLALSDFTFVWGSTFQLSDGLVAGVTDFLALPWSSVLPAATVDTQVITDSRFHPALTELGRADIERMRGWWPFLFMSLACYALLPRVILWLVSRFYFGRFIKASFIAYPRSDLVLARMRSPIVETQGAASGGNRTLGKGRRLSEDNHTPPDGRLPWRTWPIFSHSSTR